MRMSLRAMWASDWALPCYHQHVGFINSYCYIEIIYMAKINKTMAKPSAWEHFLNIRGL